MATGRDKRIVSGALLGYAANMGGPRVSLAALNNIDDIQIISAAEASLTIENDGDLVEYTSLLGLSDVGDWITPKAAAGSAYDVRVTVNSGSLSSGTSGSWLSLGSSRSWGVSVSSGGGAASANITIEIRKASSGVVQASTTITISASSGA